MERGSLTGCPLIRAKNQSQQAFDMSITAMIRRCATCFACCQWAVAPALLVLFAGLLTSAAALAAPWIDGGDRSLRSDIELLAARGLIAGPVTTWPIPAGQFANLQEGTSLAGQPEHVRKAAQRVLTRLGGPGGGLRPSGEVRVASDPNLIRDFGDNARDEVDARVGLDYDGERFAANLRVGALSGFDGNGYRPTLDGSYATALLGNWQLYGGFVEKWYGPGQVSSLILSNNSRPFPKIGITRNGTEAFETRWLSWLGNWQLDFFVGLLEEQRRQVQDTWVGSLRFEFMPAQGFTVAITRAVQFCGESLGCNPLEAAFAINNTDSDRNNSNDQATIEFKYVRDFNRFTVSPYVQFLNDDTGPFINAFTSYLTGLNWAGPWGASGAAWSFTAEYSDTRATDDWFEFDDRLTGLAYNNDEYADGFRYRGRTIGFSLDSDSTLISLVGGLTDSRGRHYRLAWHNAQISTAELAALQATGTNFQFNSVSAQPVNVHQIEGGISAPWRNFLFDLSVRWQDATPFPDRGSEFNVEAGVQFRF